MRETYRLQQKQVVSEFEISMGEEVKIQHKEIERMKSDHDLKDFQDLLESEENTDFKLRKRPLNGIKFSKSAASLPHDEASNNKSGYATPTSPSQVN